MSLYVTELYRLVLEAADDLPAALAVGNVADVYACTRGPDC